MMEMELIFLLNYLYVLFIMQKQPCTIPFYIAGFILLLYLKSEVPGVRNVCGAWN